MDQLTKDLLDKWKIDIGGKLSYYRSMSVTLRVKTTSVSPAPGLYHPRLGLMPGFQHSLHGQMSLPTELVGFRAL